MFGCTWAGDGALLGNVQNVTGQGGSLGEGLSYDYLYNQGPDSYVDYINANGGTILFKSQDALNRAISCDGPSNNYRAIHSTFIFGALRDGSKNKDELMATYMDYVLSAPGVAETTQDYVRDVMLGPSPFTHTTNLRFTLTQSSHVTIRIYNSVGQFVRELIDARLNQGSHQFLWNGDDDVGQNLSSGTYIVRLEINETVINQTIVLMK
ncbi:hypothetical protein AMJ52_00700 [candidate division TA06 bacterium DG_78]|uniref:FlgD/Vpr Ig-like domain-containing protein n=1 Tax=candidate division TA06 bacterium DG_78 TaxID=1703772 RepID=A0A0S7YIR3_UNCT6|nr:MAG: hypothetical protein AMJ52_00700 [candidate division TA06 bacterium DG_78]